MAPPRVSTTAGIESTTPGINMMTHATSIGAVVRVAWAWFIVHRAVPE
jgi:hypothetical protein